MDVNGRSGVKAMMDLFACGAVLHNLWLDTPEDITKEWYEEIDRTNYWTEDDADEYMDIEDDRRISVYNAIIEDYYT